MCGDNGQRRASYAPRLAARCCCVTLLFFGLANPNPGTRIVADSTARSRSSRQYPGPRLASVKSAIKKPASRQSVARERHRASGYDYFRDAEHLRSESQEGSLRLSLQKYRSAITRFKEERDKQGEARALLRAGEVLGILGEQDDALIQYRRAFNLVPAANDRRLEVDILNRLAEVEIERRDRVDELHAQRALDLAVEARYNLGAAGALKNLGVLAYIKHDPARATGYFNRALALWKGEGDLAGQAEALMNLGFTRGDSGEVSKALEYFDRALALAKAAGDPQKEARVFLAIGLVHTTRGEWQKALDQYQRTVLILKKIGDRVTQAIALNGLGYLYSELGDAGQSLAKFNRSLDLSRKMGHRGRQALTLGHIASIYAEMGHGKDALRIYRELIRIAPALQDRKIEAYALNDAGVVYESMGNLKMALRCYKRALEAGRSLNHPRVQAYSLDHLGTLYRRMHRRTEARAQYEAALSLMGQAGDRTGETLVSYNIAKLEQDEGQIDDALRDIEKVIRVAESLRSEVISSDLRASYFASVYRNYELLIDLRMQKHSQWPASGYDLTAFEASELGRARSLTEMLIEARATIRGGAPPELHERERAVSIELGRKAAAEMELREIRFSLEKNKPAKGVNRAEELAQNTRDSESIRREISELTAQLEQVTTEITVSSPGKYEALLRARPISLKQLQTNLLDSDTLLLEYSLGEERSYLWVVGTESFKCYVLPGRAEIEGEAYRFYRALTSISRAGNDRAFSGRRRVNARAFTAARDRLSRTLLAPIAGSIGSKRLVIVPSGALQYVPFAALIEPGPNEPLIVTHELAMLPSLSVLLELRDEISNRPRAARTLAMFADPVVEQRDQRLSGKKTEPDSRPAVPARGARRGSSIVQRARDPLTNLEAADGAVNFVRLPFAAEEADAIAALVPEGERAVWTGFEANRQTATSDGLNQFRIIHFATHGLLDFHHPKLSCLLLSRFDKLGQPQDGFLRLQDVYNLKLSADLVVLSACQTALGKEIRGEGLVGLTRGFLYAGAARVVASLWNVDDNATSKLMERFYGKMFGPEKLTPASALRMAQIEMMREERWEDPHFWAAFVLQGEWK